MGLKRLTKEDAWVEPSFLRVRQMEVASGRGKDEWYTEDLYSVTRHRPATQSQQSVVEPAVSYTYITHVNIHFRGVFFLISVENIYQFNNSQVSKAIQVSYSVVLF